MATVSLLRDSSIDISYHSHDLPSLSDDSFNTESSPIASPKKAFSMQLPSRLRLQSTTAEITPPPSPPASDREGGRRESNVSRFAPILNRASSALSSTRNSMSPRRRSPVRDGSLSPSRSPMRSTILEDEPASSASISSPSAQRANKAATAFADFFQGSSEMVSGFSMSPKRQDSFYTERQRPSHARKNSTMSAAANFFGRSSPTKQYRSREQEEDDEMLNLDIDHELFPEGVPHEIGLPDFDELRGNAEKLFMRMQISYEAKVDTLRQQRTSCMSLQQELDEAESRAAHLKSQLYSLTQEQDSKIQDLEAELDIERNLRKAEKEMRVRTVRMVSKDEPPTLDHRGMDGHRLFSGDREDGLYSLEQAGFESGDESCESSGESGCWSPLDSPPASSRSASPARPGWPDMGAASLMEENLRLKARVSELEETVDGCLGLVGSL